MRQAVDTGRDTGGIYHPRRSSESSQAPVYANVMGWDIGCGYISMW